MKPAPSLGHGGEKFKGDWTSVFEKKQTTRKTTCNTRKPL